MKKNSKSSKIDHCYQVDPDSLATLKNKTFG